MLHTECKGRKNHRRKDWVRSVEQRVEVVKQARNYFTCDYRGWRDPETTGHYIHRRSLVCHV